LLNKAIFWNEVAELGTPRRVFLNFSTCGLDEILGRIRGDEGAISLRNLEVAELSKVRGAGRKISETYSWYVEEIFWDPQR
jgi:hypothetical protein